MTTLPPLDPALTYFVGVDHGVGADAPEPPPVHVDEWAGRRVVIIGEVPGDTPIWNRRALLAGLAWQAAGAAVDPVLAPIPPAALAAFDLPTPVKKNRAQDRAAGQRGKRKK